MMSSAKALVLVEPGRLEEREFPPPDLGEEDGLLQVEACGLCGTDHEQFSGALHPGYAFVPGHETVGVVVAAGRKAAERWGVEVGQRVAVEVFQSCRRCDECEQGRYRFCREHGIADMYGFVSVDREPGLWGGYSTHQYLAPDSMLLPVPDGLDPVTATLFNPLGAGVRWASRLPQTGSGNVVAVLGPGIRGICSLVAAKEAGAEFVMVTGLGETDRLRLEVAREFGADVVVDVSGEDPVTVLHREVGSLADVVVDVTAKAPRAFLQALDLVKPGGTVVVAGTRASGPLEGFDPDLLVFKEIRVLGALGVDADSYLAAFEILASGRYPFEDLPRRVVGFGELGGLLEAMASGDPQRPLHAVVRPPGKDEFA
ncbi:MAG: alcohol dehydrogenase [Acidimicrobiales bacterium]|nr:MAG: alcohol dehydrogenase [Acidimicrobiales bacterium]